MDIYRLFTKDEDGILGEDQILHVDYNDFNSLENSYAVGVV